MSTNNERQVINLIGDNVPFDYEAAVETWHKQEWEGEKGISIYRTSNWTATLNTKLGTYPLYLHMSREFYVGVCNGHSIRAALDMKSGTISYCKSIKNYTVKDLGARPCDDCKKIPGRCRMCYETYYD